jgi:vacuolar-type H+-ATPase subunit H
MSNYIDKDKLIRDLINKGFYPAIVKNAIEQAPTEDVVSRAEVEKWKNACEHEHKEVCRLEQEQFENLVHIVEEAEQEVAREILDEFEQIINKHYNNYIFGNNDLCDEEKEAIMNFSTDVMYDIYEARKKYIGE